MKSFVFPLVVALTVGCASTTNLTTDPRWRTQLDRLPLVDRNLHSLMILDHGEVRAEWYRDGWDSILNAGGGLVPLWRTQGPGTVHDGRSTTKSVVALLAGTVLARHPEWSLASRVADFPELAVRASTESRDTTLEDLLGMTSALAWREWGHPWWDSDETGLVTEADPMRHVLGRPRTGSPGQTFRYSGGNTQVAARILELIDGRPLEAIAQADLWIPLGIEPVAWGRRSDGEVLAFAGLGLRSRDLAKLGQLVADRGRWEGLPVVPEDWIRRITAPRVDTHTGWFDLDDAGTWYGLGWWTGTIDVGGQPQRWVSTVGNGGQRVFVVPELGRVVVLTAGDYGDPSIQIWETKLLATLMAVW